MNAIKYFVCLLLLLCFPLQTIYAEEPQLAARGAALIDAESGRLLWGKNADTPMEMASTTKIMTAILVLEKSRPEEIVTISKNAAKQPDVQMDLEEGEQWYVGDLLRAMMLQSYNDAAVALAEHVSGSVEAFCMEMTAKAAQIGAKNTVFGSPNGLDSHLSQEQHHSTPYDMGLITGYALQNPMFQEVVTLPSHTFCDVSGKKTHTAVNADRFLQMYAGALGVKTGYTNKAGHCFVGAAEQEDTTLVSVVLGCGWGSDGKEAKWTDTKTLMDYGFATYTPYTVVQKGDLIGSVAVVHATQAEANAIAESSYTGVFSQKEQEQIEIKVHLPESLRAPIAKGSPIGHAEISLQGEILAKIPLVAAEDIASYTFTEQLQQLFRAWCRWMDFLEEN